MASRRPRTRAGAPEPPRTGALADEAVVLDPDQDGQLSDARITEVVGEDLDDVELSRCVVEGVRLTARSARRLRLTDVVLRDCELSGADLQEASLLRVRLERCRAEGLDAGLLRATDVVVVDTKLTGAGLRMTSWERSAFEGCDLRDVELLESTLDGVEVTGCDLTGADVTRIRTTGLRFRASRLDGLKGSSALGGAMVDSPQIVPLALALFADLGIVVDDDDDG